MLLIFLFSTLIFVLCAVVGYLVFRLRSVEQALALSQADLQTCRLTLEISEDVGRFGSWHLNADTKALKWSDYVFDMHERRQSLGQPKLENAILYYHPDDRSKVDTAVSQALGEGKDFELSGRILTENGNELPVLARGTCQIGSQGEVLGIFGCIVDLSLPDQRHLP